MRLWSLHPRYLDRQGLLAVWREGLLAQKVLLGQTKGYKNHPQLERFKRPDYLIVLQIYLAYVYYEAKERGYNFNPNKLCHSSLYWASINNYPYKITITKGQLVYEFKHLQRKLYRRDRKKYMLNKYYDRAILYNLIDSHPLFTIVEGDIEKWERPKKT